MDKKSVGRSREKQRRTHTQNHFFRLLGLQDCARFVSLVF
jgi:hypothetical protein